MLRDNLVRLIVPMRSCGTQALGDEFSYLENPRPVGAESSLTGRCSSPFQTEPRQSCHQGHPYTDRKAWARSDQLTRSCSESFVNWLLFPPVSHMPVEWMLRDTSTRKGPLSNLF